jgi:hypothetical protein
LRSATRLISNLQLDVAFMPSCHTRGETTDEVTLNELNDRAEAEQKAGWEKIEYCGEQAREDASAPALATTHQQIRTP